MNEPEVAVVGYLSLDTLLLPDGRKVETPGGAALYAALGVLAAGGKPRIYACVGADFPRRTIDALGALGIDVGPLLPVPEPSRRATLAYVDGDRRGSPHHDDRKWWRLTQLMAPPVPDRSANAFALCPMPVAHLARVLRAPVVAAASAVVDTSEAYVGDGGAALLAAIGGVGLFAPSVAETRRMRPDLSDDAALADLARIIGAVVQKRGAAGLALARDGRAPLLRPAGAAAVVDPTGAGDATVGALAVGLARGLDDEGLLDLALAVAARAIGGIGPKGLGLT